MPSYPAAVVRCLERRGPDHRDSLPSLVDFHAANRQRYELRNKRREAERERKMEREREVKIEGGREGERARFGRRGELVRGERMRTGFMLYIIPMTDAPHRLCW